MILFFFVARGIFRTDFSELLHRMSFIKRRRHNPSVRVDSGFLAEEESSPPRDQRHYNALKI